MRPIKRFWFAMVMLVFVAGCGSGGGSVSDTWVDPTTGYEWQVNPSDNNGNWFTWQQAMDYCKNLSLDGGNWHLPTISELRTLIRGCPATVTGGSCKATDNCLKGSCEDNSCEGCDVFKGPGPKGVYGPSELKWFGNDNGNDFYWSSSPEAGHSYGAWYVDFDDGDVYHDDKGFGYDAKCVRLGH